MKQLTEKENKLFNKVLDLNYKMDNEINSVKKLTLLGELINAKVELKKEMGDEAYEEFFSMGAKLFAQKKEDK